MFLFFIGNLRGIFRFIGIFLVVEGIRKGYFELFFIVFNKM